MNFRTFCLSFLVVSALVGVAHADTDAANPALPIIIGPLPPCTSGLLRCRGGRHISLSIRCRSIRGRRFQRHIRLFLVRGACRRRAQLARSEADTVRSRQP